MLSKHLAEVASGKRCEWAGSGEDAMKAIAALPEGTKKSHFKLLLLAVHRSGSLVFNVDSQSSNRMRGPPKLIKNQFQKRKEERET